MGTTTLKRCRKYALPVDLRDFHHGLLDRLGMEKVYVQAKRWQGTVGRPEAQGFYGALAGQRANKGVFITTSSFTQQALDFAKSVGGLYSWMEKSWQG